MDSGKLYSVRITLQNTHESKYYLYRYLNAFPYHYNFCYADKIRPNNYIRISLFPPCRNSQKFFVLTSAEHPVIPTAITIFSQRNTRISPFLLLFTARLMLNMGFRFSPLRWCRNFSESPYSLSHRLRRPLPKYTSMSGNSFRSLHFARSEIRCFKKYHPSVVRKALVRVTDPQNNGHGGSLFYISGMCVAKKRCPSPRTAFPRTLTPPSGTRAPRTWVG